jgi:hypothetical protein
MEHYLPNTTAGIFWLKDRRSIKLRDKAINDLKRLTPAEFDALAWFVQAWLNAKRRKRGRLKARRMKGRSVSAETQGAHRYPRLVI